jgi:hypothetical protein
MDIGLTPHLARFFLFWLLQPISSYQGYTIILKASYSTSSLFRHNVPVPHLSSFMILSSPCQIILTCSKDYDYAIVHRMSKICGFLVHSQLIFWHFLQISTELMEFELVPPSLPTAQCPHKPPYSRQSPNFLTFKEPRNRF